MCASFDPSQDQFSSSTVADVVSCQVPLTNIMLVEPDDGLPSGQLDNRGPVVQCSIESPYISICRAKMASMPVVLASR